MNADRDFWGELFLNLWASSVLMGLNVFRFLVFLILKNFEITNVSTSFLTISFLVNFYFSKLFYSYADSHCHWMDKPYTKLLLNTFLIKIKIA